MPVRAILVHQAWHILVVKTTAMARGAGWRKGATETSGGCTELYAQLLRIVCVCVCVCGCVCVLWLRVAA